jgi:nucleotide-binding universal stress UspA family protein
MIDINRILCPIDFSPGSEHALAHAAALARWYESQLTVLHVSEVFLVPAVLPGNPSPVIGPYISRDAIVNALERFTTPLKQSGVPFDIDIEEGTAVHTIVDAAARLAVDLLVMGTHGRGGVEHILLGSVTEKVLRRAPCPLLVVPPSTAIEPPPVLLERILCPVDFGPSAMKALNYALSLAQESDATITVLHVLEPVPAETAGTPAMIEFLRERDAKARNDLRAAIPTEARDWCHPIELTGSGKPYKEILRVAHETAASLIVMGVAGRGVLDRMFFGSTTNHVVRHAECPVLTLH